MYFINVYDKTTDKNWKEEFDSEYFFRKRLTKLIEQDVHIDMVNNRYVWRD